MRISMASDVAAGDADILVRAFRGEDVERTPVWLMRQVSRLELSLMPLSQLATRKIRSSYQSATICASNLHLKPVVCTILMVTTYREGWEIHSRFP